MEGWTDRQMHGRTDRRTDGRTDGRAIRYTDRRTVGRTDSSGVRWSDERVDRSDGGMDGLTNGRKGVDGWMSHALLADFTINVGIVFLDTYFSLDDSSGEVSFEFGVVDIGN